MMGKILAMSKPKFERSELHSCGLTLFNSACTSCGEKGTVNAHNGSIAAWEKAHICKNPGDAKHASPGVLAAFPKKPEARE